MEFNTISSNNVLENNIKHITLPFDTNGSIHQRQVINVYGGSSISSGSDIVKDADEYINEPTDFTITPPRKQNPWSGPGGGTVDSWRDTGCHMRYSNNQNALGMVCGDINYKNDEWVRGNMFSNKYPYKLYHKIKKVPTTKIIRNNPVIKKNSPYWPEPNTYTNINMYDYKSYPDLRNESRDTDGKPLFRYPYNPLNNNTESIEIEGFSNSRSGGDCQAIKYLVLFLTIFGICYVVKK